MGSTGAEKGYGVRFGLLEDGARKGVATKVPEVRRVRVWRGLCRRGVAAATPRARPRLGAGCTGPRAVPPRLGRGGGGAGRGGPRGARGAPGTPGERPQATAGLQTRDRGETEAEGGVGRPPRASGRPRSAAGAARRSSRRRAKGRSAGPPGGWVASATGVRRGRRGSTRARRRRRRVGVGEGRGRRSGGT